MILIGKFSFKKAIIKQAEQANKGNCTKALMIENIEKGKTRKKDYILITYLYHHQKFMKMQPHQV
jgi:hypothetical protein